MTLESQVTVADNPKAITRVVSSALLGELDLRLTDCMELMRETPDNAYDLAIVDPPYVDDFLKLDYATGRKHNCGRAPISRHHISKELHLAPKADYFKELFRVSKNQIVWGGNYFGLPPSSCWIVWDKDNGEVKFADCELAWTSFKTAVRKFRFRWAGMLQGNMAEKEKRIHPTQKPVALYRWLLTKYAKPGQRILDTHMGSGSIAIACKEAGHPLTACEIDKDYYDQAIERIKRETQQQRLLT